MKQNVFKLDLRRDKDLLLKATQACINSYKGKYGEEILGIFPQNPVWHEEHIAKWYHVEDGETLWLVFRGTYGAKGWEADFDYCQQKIQIAGMDFYAHYGFYTDCFLPVKDELLKVVRNSGKRKLIITGHSQGGAVALIAGLEFEYQLFLELDEITVIALAPPRIGNKALKKVYQDKYSRASYPRTVKKKLGIILQNGWDTVCRVPFVLMIGKKDKGDGKGRKLAWLSYRHPIKRQRIGLTLWRWVLLFIPIVGNIIRIIGNPINHYPQQYLESLKKIK